LSARGAGELAARHDPEVDEHDLEQLVDRLRRLGDRRLHGAAIEVARRSAATSARQPTSTHVQNCDLKRHTLCRISARAR